MHELLPKSVIRLTEVHVLAFRNRLRPLIPELKASHLAEAVASGLGFPSNRVLRQVMCEHPPGRERLASFNTAACIARLGRIVPELAPQVISTIQATTSCMGNGIPFGIHIICCPTTPDIKAFARMAPDYCLPHENGLVCATKGGAWATNGDGASFVANPGHDRVDWIRGWMRSKNGPFYTVAVDDLMLIPDFAFLCAMTGHTAVGCMTAPSAGDAVRMLRDAGIPDCQGTDPVMVRRVDTYGADGIMKDSVSTTKAWLREAYGLTCSDDVHTQKPLPATERVIRSEHEQCPGHEHHNGHERQG